MNSYQSREALNGNVRGDSPSLTYPDKIDISGGFPKQVLFYSFPPEDIYNKDGTA